MFKKSCFYKLLNTAKNTEFGKEHYFSAIRDYTDFTNAVPIQKYESIEPLIERCRKGEQNLFWPTPIKWFAKSSGTTNAKSKFIPVSDEAIRILSFKSRQRYAVSCILTTMKTAQLFTGKGLKV